MLAPFLFLCATLQGTPCSNCPMTQLKTSYPFGEQQALTVTPDDQLAFVAEGAAIAILKVGTFTSTTPTVTAL